MELCYKEHFPLKMSSSIYLNNVTLVNPAGVLEWAAVVHYPDPRLHLPSMGDTLFRRLHKMEEQYKSSLSPPFKKP